MHIRLKDHERIKVGNSSDIYGVMQQILLRENRIDRDREHFWTISLNTAQKILNIELVSLGSIKTTVVEPMEVFSIPLQKRAVKVILVHNHPSGEVHPSDTDKDLTDRLIQVGKIMHVPVLDHLIITENSFYSFVDSGLLAELEKSLKYVPAFEIKRRFEKQAREIGEEKGKKDRSKEMARAMKRKGYEITEIEELTGLSKASIQKLKID